VKKNSGPRRARRRAVSENTFEFEYFHTKGRINTNGTMDAQLSDGSWVPDRRLLIDAFAIAGIRALLAAKADAARDAERWLPIESAPKDGTLVLAGELEDCGFVLERGGSSIQFYQNVARYEGGKWQAWGQNFQPTHWRPLPPPPAAAPSEGEAHG
jgi:hypothetical protein